MKFKQSLQQLSAGGVLAIVIVSGVCGGLFTMPLAVRAENHPAVVVMEQCQGTIAHQHDNYDGPLLTVNHGAARPADCCVNRARYYQTFLKPSDGQKIIFNLAAMPALVTLALVNFSQPQQYIAEIFPPPQAECLRTVIKRE